MFSRITPFILSFYLLGCGGGSQSPESVSTDAFDSGVEPVIDGAWYKPEPGVSWQIQLQGELDLSIDAALYEVDLFDTDAEVIAKMHQDGKRVLCYFNGGAYEEWREDEGSFPSEALGKDMDGWEGEKWLDIRNSGLIPVMQKRLDLAVSKGCDGVDPDNMDSYNNDTGFPLTYDDQLGYNRYIANEARKRGLAVALKNDLEQIGDLVAYFDLAVNEQCHAYNECEMLLPFIDQNKAVLNIEYDQSYISQPAPVCQESQALGIDTLILPYDLDGSWRISCD